MCWAARLHWFDPSSQRWETAMNYKRAFCKSIGNGRSLLLYNGAWMYCVQDSRRAVNSWLWYSDTLTCVFARWLITVDKYSPSPFNLQTEDPAMERPYTFKDFLLRPRRSVSIRSTGTEQYRTGCDKWMVKWNTSYRTFKVKFLCID